MSDQYLSPDLLAHRERYMSEIQDVILLSRRQQADLWMRAMDGDEQAWQTLWMQGVKMVVKLVRKFIQLGFILPGDELDAIQAGNLAIGESLREWTPNRGAYSTYIWSCIRNALRDFNLGESRAGLTGVGSWEALQDEFGDREGDGIDSLQIAVQIDLERILEPSEREIVELLIYHDMTQDQAARVAGVSQATVARTLRRSLDKLHEAYLLFQNDLSRSE